MKQLSTGTARIWFDTVDPGMSETLVSNYNFWWNTTTKKMFVCEDDTENAEVWTPLVKDNDFDGLFDECVTEADLAPQVQSDWAQSDNGSLSFIKNKPSERSQSSASRSLDTVFQVSPTRDCIVSYSVAIEATLSVATGAKGTVFLEIASDESFTQNVQELGRLEDGNTGSIAVTTNTTITVCAPLYGYVPPGYYVRLRTNNDTNTPTFTYRSGQEVLL